MDDKESSTRVVMLPWLAHGHISPFLELAKKLIDRNFYIYLCSTPVNLNSVKNKITDKYSVSLEIVDLNLPSLPDLPPHYHTTNGLPTNLMPTLKTAYELSSPNFSNILKTTKPDLVIYDFNQPWAPDIASSLNIPAVQFLTTGGVPFSFGLHMLKRPGEKFPFPEIHYTKIDRIGSSSEDNWKDRDRFLGAVERSCNIILLKTFRGIEGKYLDYLSSFLGKKMVPIGPLVQEPIDEDEHIEIIKWLDNKEKCSTVFVSFGSECFLSKEETLEVAYGLELSKVNFIWVLRFPVGEKIRVEDALPKGFLERVGERGVIADGWAPQVNILRHLSIGGFVSHCGWSSVMESMKFGVPIIAMPMQFDQPLNARLVVEVGVGVEVVKDNNRMVAQRQEIADVIRNVVVEKSGDYIRAKARELSDNMRIKGEVEIDVVVEELLLLCRERDAIGHGPSHSLKMFCRQP